MGWDRLVGVGTAILLGAVPASTGQLVNVGFEQRNTQGGPVGWEVVGTYGPSVYTATLVPGEHGAAARLVGAQDGAAKLRQIIDATPWRGKDVVLTARLRIEPSTHAGLTIGVDRPEPNATGFHDENAEQDAPVGGNWFTARKLAHVDDDALTIELGLGLRGPGAVTIDDVALVEETPSTQPPSAAATAYLESALSWIGDHHYRIHEVGWPALAARARREIAGAQTPRDTWWAIRALLGTLGDHHSLLMEPRPRPSGEHGGEGEVATVPMPTARLISGRFGWIALPGLNTFGPTGAGDGVRYVATARAALTRLDAQPLCGWIVDLRSNWGGNMWPMLNSISPLLGHPPYGAFVGPGGVARGRWVRSAIGVSVEGATVSERHPIYAPFQLRQAGAPLAVLTSNDTESSGEAVAIAIAGRPASRRFGVPTGGYTTANVTTTLSDGAVLAVAAGWERDRLGRDYRDRVAPDDATPQPLAAAQRWLRERCASAKR